MTIGTSAGTLGCGYFAAGVEDCQGGVGGGDAAFGRAGGDSHLDDLFQNGEFCRVEQGFGARDAVPEAEQLFQEAEAFGVVGRGGGGGGPGGGEGSRELACGLGVVGQFGEGGDGGFRGFGAQDLGEAGVQAGAFDGEQVVVDGLADEDVAELVAGVGRQEQVALDQFA
ncbi:hypothetical protein GL307_17705 [Nocardia seriolae]|uniref:hypothetical protein n=1 Tax=Nocardia seriolae TaxID=37332 RepID=UPI0012BD5BA3|nr:hypothetical protein [Nocardia seriolae]MTL13357.1 hypothetical protein [Nocardia seriolae]